MSSIGSPADIESAKGKLGVLMPGLGAVSTTFIADTLAIRKGISSPIGSLTQMGSLRLGKRTDNNEVEIKNFVPLSSLDDLVFGGWDIFEDNCYEAAVNAGVIDTKLLDQVKDELSSIKPRQAKSIQIKSNKDSSNQIKSDEINSSYVKSSRVKSIDVRSTQAKLSQVNVSV